MLNRSLLVAPRPRRPQLVRLLSFSLAGGIASLLLCSLGCATARIGGRARVPRRALGRPATAPDVLRAMVRALDARDAALLCRVADPDDVKHNHLNPRIVSLFLRQGAWKHGGLETQSVRLRYVGSGVHKYPYWVLHVRNNGDAFVVELDHYEGAGWKLLLSLLLYDINWRYAVPSPTYLSYRQLAERYGVTGIRFSQGRDSPLSDLPEHIGFHREGSRLVADWGPVKHLRAGPGIANERGRASGSGVKRGRHRFLPGGGHRTGA